MGLLRWLDRREQWWKVFVVIFAVSITVVGYIGYKTYAFAPPVADFVDARGATVIPADAISAGQEAFLRLGLMDYGSFLGDGGLRGPDFTAEALAEVTRSMSVFHERALAPQTADPEVRARLVRAHVQEELKRNTHDPVSGRIALTDAQNGAYRDLVRYYAEKFGHGGPSAGREVFSPPGYVTDPVVVEHLTAFFYWGAWLCAAKRPGFEHSYTHNWPYDPAAGNTPTPGVLIWSVIGTLVLILALGCVFHLYGKLDREGALALQSAQLPAVVLEEAVEKARPTPTQRACYKFFAVAAVLFVVQISAGLLAIGDFLGIPGIGDLLPITVTRAWHSQISVLWIAVCWFAAAIWVLPFVCVPEPRNQVRWINALFAMLVVVAAGTLIGIPLGIHGALGDAWRWFGLQGWEFVQFGRAYQYVLYAAFVTWFVIVARGVWPILRRRETWSLPNWMIYAIAGIILMFSAGFVAGPRTNFVIADFWRWCTIHMWVEAFFELFTTILVAYFMLAMGFVTHAVASRVVYLAAVLFLGSGLIGISHNFYWNAKSIETIALGGVLSTLQVVPLVLLTLDSWRFRNMPAERVAQARAQGRPRAVFGMAEPFAFLVAVNFWNFFGAGVFGFIINLPIVNYYQHGTYLTVNHGHAALFGVYGNLAIAAMLYCARWAVTPAAWSPRLLRIAFWSLNLGLLLMVVVDLFPVGVHQLMVAASEGLARARSQAYVEGSVFQSLTWLRGIGVVIFVIGGVLPLAWFILSRWRRLKAADAARAGTCDVPTRDGAATISSVTT